MEPKGTAVLLKGKDKRIRSGYPWIPNSEIKEIIGVKDGDLAIVLDHNGETLGIATYNSVSRFPLKILTTQVQKIDQLFFETLIERSVNKRIPLNLNSNAIRIIFAEADHLPGLIVDQYDNHLVVQIRSLGMEKLKQYWLPALIKCLAPESILERSDMAGRAEEGLPEIIQPLHGTPPTNVLISEHGHLFQVPIQSGLKTGYYLDQRNSRKQLAGRVKSGDKVLDCFCYSGGFSIYATKAGADCTAVDISEIAIQTAIENSRLNDLKINFVQDNVFEYLEKDLEIQYDWIILDPPAISKTAENRDALKWAIWNLVHRAIPHLKVGGRLIVCSCSYQLNLENLIATARLAANDRSCELVLEEITIQDADHPAPLHFPESLYLKCIWLRLTEK